MRRPNGALVFFGITSALSVGLAVSAGCQATATPNGTAGSGGTSTTAPGGGGTNTGTGGEGGDGNTLIIDDGGSDVNNDAMMNPCGTQCGAMELCDPDHAGLDDNCNGLVDEDCGCSAGTAHFCFKGDPSYLNTPGCFAGTQKCTENGEWGPCVGGVHATDDQKCYTNDVVACHPISAVPFQEVNLIDGTGNFSSNAVLGSEVWTVECPPGVTPCPGVSGVGPSDDFKPLQSGEYTITYTKGLAAGGTDSCTYPLFVGAPGLRVELEWEHDLGDDGVDLDLHLHQPNNTQPWSTDYQGVTQDCTWSNCTIEKLDPLFGSNVPKWFFGAAPPEPVEWYLDQTFEKNTCYFSPRGQGQEWQDVGMGCRNPRLDLDNISCNPAVSNVESFDFCAPENANIDYPPVGEWTRIGVHYFSSDLKTYNVHPRIKVFCDGALAAELGPAGYFDPEAPITFVPSDGDGLVGNRFWVVADVAFTDSACGNKSCVVKPVYSDAATKTPLFLLDTTAEANFGPAYPPLP